MLTVRTSSGKLEPSTSIEWRRVDFRCPCCRIDARHPRSLAASRCGNLYQDTGSMPAHSSQSSELDQSVPVVYSSE